MADIQANIGIGVDTSQALAAIRQLQREISVFHTLMAKGGAAAAAKSVAMQQGLINTINETGKFSASMTRISSSTESFTNALEKNKLSMTQYFRYAGGASKSFGKMFSKEFNTINRVATERVKDLQTQYISMGRDANGALQAIKVRPLALDMDNLGTKVMLASQRQQIFNQLLKQGTTNLLNFGKNTQWAGRQLMVGFTIPLTIFGATAAREFQKLEEQAVKFRRVYGDMFTTDADTEKALANVRELANEFTKYGIAVEKTVGLAAKVAQMGNVGEDLTAQVTQATRLAVLGGMEQEEALDTTISLTNAFGIAAEDLAGKIAFLNAAENQTILAIEDFNEAIPKAGSVVQQLGGDVEDLAFMLTAMREGGINASQAANAIKSSLGRMINPTVAAQEKLKGFGIDIMGIVENNAGNLQNTIMQLGYALNNLDPLDRARAIETLFGKFQFARMSTMFQNIIKDGSQANKVLQLTTNSTEELAIIAERELKRVEDSVSFKFQKQLEKLQAALAPLGEEFLKAVTPLVEFGTKLLKSFNELGDGGKQFIVVLTAIAGVVAPAALMAFGLVANGVANLIKFLSLLGRGFAGLSGQSTILGGQTEYMTQQQIEAAAVAASLGQSHSNLTQIFTAETSAISALVAQYQAAITAQRQLSIGQTARGVATRPPKFASGGIVRGPGTGTSDSILAMVSDGEAIIPAEQAKKYKMVVEQLISGNIPGYASGRTQSGRRSYGPNELPIYGEYMGRFEPRVANQAGQAGVPRSIDVGAPLAMRTAEAMGMPTTPRAVGANPEPYQEILQNQSQMVSKFVERLNVHLETTYADIENSTQQMSAAWKAAGQDVQEDVSQISDPKQRLVAERTFGIQEDFYSTIPTAARNPGETQPTSERASAFLPSKTGIKSYRENSRAAKVLAEIQTGEDFSGYDFGHAGESRVTTLQDIARDPAAGSAVVRAGRVKGQDIDLAAIQSEGASTFNKLGSELVESAEDGWRTSAQQNSPSKKFFDLGSGAADSLADGFEQGMADEKGTVGKKPLPGKLAAPLPPVPPADAARTFDKGMKGVFQKVGDGVKKNAKALGEKMLTPIGVAIGKAAGNTITDNDGNVLYDADAAQARQNLGLGEPTTLPSAEPLATDKNGKPIVGPNGKPYTKSEYKEVVKEGKRQARQSRAGKALMGMGAVTAGLGAATQLQGVEIAGINVAETAQKLLPVAGALTAILPMLLALPAPLALLAAVIGAGVYAWMQYNKKLKEVTENARGLAESLGAGSKALDRFAEFAGTVKASDVMRERRQAGVLAKTAGKSEFGEQFVGSEQGKELIDTIEKGLVEIGREGVIDDLGEQLSTAIYSNTLTREQANGIALELGRAVGDLSLSVGIIGEVNQLIGPDGVDILKNGLSIGVRLIQRTQEDIFGAEGTVSDLMDAIVDPENTEGIRGWFSSLFDVPELQATLAGELIAAAEQGQEIIDANQKAAEDRIDQLKEEAAQLREQGKLTEANAKLAEAEGVRLKFEEDRTRLLQQASAGAKQLFAQYEEVASLQERIDEIGNVLTYTGSRGGDIETVRQFLQDYEAFTGVKILDKDLVNATDNELRQAFNNIKGGFGELNKIADGLEGTLGQMGQIVIDRFKDTDIAGQVEKLINEISGSDDIEFNVKYNLLAGVGAEAFSIDQVSDFLERYVTKPSAVTADEIADYRRGLRARSEPYTDAEIRDLIVEENARQQERFSGIMDSLGMGAGQQLMGIFGKVDRDAQEGIMRQIELDLKVEGDVAAQETLDLFSNLSQYEGEQFNAEVVLDYYSNDPRALDELQDKLLDTQELIDEYGQLKVEQIIETKIIEDEAAVASLKANTEYFESLDPVQQKLYIMTFLSSMSTITDEEVMAERMRRGPYGGAGTNEGIRAFLAAKTAEAYTEAIKALGLDDGGETPGPEGGGAAPQIDSLVKKLRDLRLATIQMKAGWEGMQQVLQSVFAGGTKSIDVFDGLSNQIRSLGVGENLIEMIVGMDPDEYEKRKGELFEFDKDGRIIKATAALKNLSAAFGAVALGEYVNSQQAFIVNTRNQISAITTLTSNGLSLAEAYQVVQDEAVAARIAMGATTEEIKELVRITQLANDLREQLEEQNERSQISEAVRKTNEEFENRVAVLDRLSKSAGQYTDAQITALLNDTNLQKLMLDPSIDQGAFNQALRNAERNAEIELRVKLATTEGTKGVFEEGLAAAMDAFSRQEQEIELNFKATTADDQALIDDAQNRIAAIQYELDDYNAELERISWQEEDINEKYDKRFEALESIAEVNERISREQQAQLDIADALSRGDIAAAARAQQALVSQQAQDATQQQRKMLEQARDAEIASLTGASGLTREQLEDRIQGLERQIFAIEESDLEPAQERVRLQEVLKQQQIDSLMVLEMTRDEWDRIKNNIDLAEASGYQFKETMQQALDVVEKLMTAYPEIKPAPPPPPPAPAPSSGGGGGGDLGQPGKGAWKIGNQTLSEIAESAGFGSWQAYYNANRGSQNLDAKLRPAASGGLMKLAMGGKVKRYAGGGMIIPKRMAMGGYSMGSDTIPAILTPGEFVVRRPAVSAFGVDNLEKINRGTYNDGSVYNYNLAVNVKSDADPNRIARVVMGEIRGIENQRIRSNRL